MPTHPNTALILAGHGSSKTNRQSRPAREQAVTLSKLGDFGTVETAFFKEAPLLNDALPSVADYETVVIVPLFMCRGFISQIVIPREMGLPTYEGAQTIIQTAPVGEHPALVDLITDRIKTHLQTNNQNAEDLSVLLVAHGNPKPEQNASRHHAERLALQIAAQIPVGAILPTYVEEAPSLRGWDTRVTTPHVLVVPLMIAAGTHSSRDIPNMIGITQSEAEETVLHEGGIPQGPYAVRGHKFWLTQAIGSHPDMIKVITALVDDYLG